LACAIRRPIAARLAANGASKSCKISLLRRLQIRPNGVIEIAFAPSRTSSSSKTSVYSVP
jgi:hypothetical protein